MPPVINSLGPITDWLGSMMFKPMIAKYDEISRASSVAKVLLATISNRQRRCEAVGCVGSHYDTSGVLHMA